MATMRMTGGSLLGAVSSTAQSVITTADTLNESINMLHKYVKHKSKQQDLDYAAQLDEMKEEAIEKASLKTAQRRMEIEKLCKDDTFAKHYNEAFKRKSKLIAEM